jgi:hypothetical protein
MAFMKFLAVILIALGIVSCQTPQPQSHAQTLSQVKGQGEAPDGVGIPKPELFSVFVYAAPG